MCDEIRCYNFWNISGNSHVKRMLYCLGNRQELLSASTVLAVCHDSFVNDRTLTTVPERHWNHCTRPKLLRLTTTHARDNKTLILEFLRTFLFMQITHYIKRKVTSHFITHFYLSKAHSLIFFYQRTRFTFYYDESW